MCGCRCCEVVGVGVGVVEFASDIQGIGVDDADLGLGEIRALGMESRDQCMRFEKLACGTKVGRFLDYISNNGQGFLGDSCEKFATLRTGEGWRRDFEVGAAAGMEVDVCQLVVAVGRWLFSIFGWERGRFWAG